MSKEIDQRVVEMQFDNKRFESNVQTTLSTLDKLKQKLNLTGASKGLENLDTAAKRVDMNGLGNAVETVRARFSALQVMGVTALTNITNSAVNAGKRMIKALTIDPIKTGFQEYETQIGAVQTILANTESKGSTLQDVNRALDELNTYADKTIYNFTEMTRNIGTFTAAGVDLDKSVTSIKGIANLAAVSGSTSQQASTAMYQLSQALAAGKVQLMDWNSVVNAGMGGQVFQDALKRTAKNMGTNVDAMIKKYGSFRESLTKGEWLTADVLTETLTQLSGAYTEADLLAKGYTKEQAKDILDLADTAVQAATKVKTFTQLWDTLKESAQSGWTQSWEIMVGDFEEAKVALTKVSDVIGNMIGESAQARNDLLTGGLSSGWKQLLGAGIADEAGFQDTIKSIAKEHGVNFDKMVKGNETFEKTLKRALKNGKIDSDMLSESVSAMAKKMANMSDEELKAAGYTSEHVKQIKELNNGLKDGSISMDDFVKKIMRPSGRQNIIDSLWNAFNGLMSVIKPIKEAFRDVFPAATGEQLYNITKNLKEFTKGLKLSDEASDKVKRTFKGLFSIFDILVKGIKAITGGLFDLSQSEGISSLADMFLSITASIGDFFTALNEGFDADGISGILSGLANGVSDFISGAVGGLEGFGKILTTIGDYIVKAAIKIWDGIKTVFTWITDNVSGGDIFAGLAGGGIFMVAKKLSGLFEKLGEVMEKPLSLLFGKKGEGSGLKDAIENFKEILGSVHDSINAFTSGIKVASLVAIAAAIAILASAMKTISALDASDIAKSLLAMGAMFTMLSFSFNSITSTLDLFSSKGVIKAGIALMMMAKAIDILADAMKKMSELSLPQIAKGLLGIGGGIAALTLGLKAMSKVKISLSTSLAMLALAESCKILGDALIKFGSMSLDEIGRGLTAMGGALAEFVAALAILKKVGGFKTILGSAGLLIAIQGMSTLADALKKFGKMKWDNIKRGLTAMGGALAELAISVGVLGKLAGFSGILGASSLTIVIGGLSDLADALKKFGKMSWDNIKQGLTAMGGALTELSISVGVLGKLAGFSGIFGSGALYIIMQGIGDLATALKKFGKMSWDEIERGVAGMGWALLELSTAVIAAGKLAGFSGIFGSGSLLLMIQGLDDLASAFAKFGEMSWDEIGRGLTAMGGALAELAIITGVLGTLAPLGAIIGSGSLLLAIQGLDDLANALQKFGDMSWDEIKRGLSAMGGALGEVALGGFLSTLSGIGAMAISEVAAPLGVLADSLKKWKDVTVPENLGWQLGLLANGIMSFTFGGSGASALATAAPAVGTMADSIKKWSDVTIPEGLAANVSSLSDALHGWTFGGMGASALADAAPAIGQMADSIKKWENVNIPAGISEELTGLADGVKAFSFAFMGGWSMSAVDGPLSSLADSVSKWANVTIPDKIDEGLKSLADGVKAFSFAFMGGWSLSAINEPLGSLAETVKKWNGVSIPANISTNLADLADGVKAFSWAFMGGLSLGTAVKPLGDLAGSLKKWNGVSIPDGLPKSLKSFATSVKTLSGVNYQKISSGLTIFSTSLSKFSSIKDSISGVGKSITNNLITPIKNASSKLSKSGATMIDSLVKGVNTKKTTLTKTATTIIDAVIKAIDGKKALFQVAGIESISKFITGISKNRNRVKTTTELAVKGAISATHDYYDSFYTAGSYLVSGFANGISANSYKAAAKARAMASAAATAAKRELNEHSPSRVFYGIGDYAGLGFVNALADYASKAYSAGSNMADQARSGLSNAIGKIADVINSDMDTQPTIRPVLDLSAVSAGAGYINDMFGMTPSVGVLSNVGAINTMMSRRQNGANADVVSAIKDLKKSLGDLSRDQYNINGVSYDDGSSISDAVQALVRAIILEGRV